MPHLEYIMKRKKKNGGALAFIYFRCIFPVLSVIATVCIMFVECYKYLFMQNSKGVYSVMSLWRLIDSTWETSRNSLFGKEEIAADSLVFSETTFWLVIVFVALFVFGAAAAIYSSVAMIKYLYDGHDRSRFTRLFVTLVPNRIILSIYQLPMIVIFALPSLWVFFSKRFFDYYVELYFEPFDMFWVAVGIFVLGAIVVGVSSYFEKRDGLDVFAANASREPMIKEKKNAEGLEEIENAEESEKEITESEDAYERMLEAQKAEQRERILRLLNAQKDENDENDKDGENE